MRVASARAAPMSTLSMAILPSGSQLASDAVSENWKRPVIWGIPCDFTLTGAVSLERIVLVPKILLALGAGLLNHFLQSAPMRDDSFEARFAEAVVQSKSPV